MGLDISAHEVITPCAMTRDAANDSDDVIWYFAYPEFQSRLDGLPEGAYRTSGRTDGFRAGSYSGYNRWREQLAKLIGTTDAGLWADGPETAPFYDLICFADNEGCIGPVTSAKLAKTFDVWRERAQAFAASFVDKSDGEYWLQKYEQWSSAFHLAAHRGAVRFH